MNNLTLILLHPDHEFLQKCDTVLIRYTPNKKNPNH